MEIKVESKGARQIICIKKERKKKTRLADQTTLAHSQVYKVFQIKSIQVEFIVFSAVYKHIVEMKQRFCRTKVLHKTNTEHHRTTQTT